MAEKLSPVPEQQTTRREVLKKAAYVAPAILTLTAVPAFAAKGSGWGKDYKDKYPKKDKDSGKGNPFGGENQKNK
jgi:hypothetical protein